MADNLTTAGVVVCFFTLVWFAIATYTFLNVWLAIGDALAIIGIALIVAGSLTYLRGENNES